MPITHYEVRRLEEIYALSVELAQHFPDPLAVQIGIYELLINALEHGNLAIDEQTKMQLVREYRWKAEVERRLQLLQHRDKHVTVELEVDEEKCCVTITDQGDGFDWRHHMAPGERVRDGLSGLGLLMVRHAGFDAITFNEKGNQVRCGVRKQAC